MKTIATIKSLPCFPTLEDGTPGKEYAQLVIELRDEDGTLIDMFPVDEIKEEREHGRI